MIDDENMYFDKKMNKIKRILGLSIDIYILLEPLLEEAISRDSLNITLLKRVSLLLKDIAYHCEDLCYPNLPDDFYNSIKN